MGQSASVAEHISTTERVAAEAEIDSVKMKKLEFFQRQLDTQDPQIFRATVLEVTKLRPARRTARGVAHRAHSYFFADGRFLCFRASRSAA